MGVSRWSRFEGDGRDGMVHWYAFECDGPGCARWLEVQGDSLYRARLAARLSGWDSDRGGLWFCPLDLDLAAEEDYPHEDWCPWVTRHAGCACRARPHRPLLGGSREPYRRIENVTVEGGLL